MIRYSETTAILRELAHQRALASESVPLEVASGRVLSRPVLNQEAVPPFDNSAMDGFAVSASWLRNASKENPLTLPVRSTVFAGDALTIAHENEPAAIEIMTGAPLPQGPWDSVVKIEETETENDSRGQRSRVRFFSPVEAGAHLRKAGEDFMPGQKAMAAGTRLGPEEILGLATLGVSEVIVRKKPQVAVISTGKELLHHSVAPLPFGKIRNSTGPFLQAALPHYGCDVTYFGVIEDDPELFRSRLRTILSEKYDLILTTGAVSMGQADFVDEALRAEGAEILFHKAAIRPGKPVLCGRFNSRGSPIFLGLPGNPVSTAVGLRFFAGVYLRELQGLNPENPFSAKLVEATKKPDGLRCFFKGVARISGESLQVFSLPGQASFMVSPLLAANCWVVLPETGGRIDAGSVVEVWPLLPETRGFQTMEASQCNQTTSGKECC